MSDGLNVTNAVPPICNRHGESMVLSFYDSHGYRNGYVCRSCMAERTQQGMNVDHDPAKSLLKPLPLSEKAELQVSLLNEIGKQMARNQEFAERMLGSLENRIMEQQHYGVMLAEQAETLKTYKLSLEGIQGLLVDNEAEIGALGAKLDAHDGHLTAIDIASYEGTQRILKERGERLDRIDAMLERIVTEIDHVAKRYSHVAARLAHIEGRLDNAMGKFIWLDARGEARLATALEAINLRLPERPVTVKRKPSLRPVSRKKRKR